MSHRQPEPKAGLRGGTFRQHDPVRYPAGQFYDPPFVRSQAVIFGEAETFAYPLRDDLHGCPHEHSLHPEEGAWKGRRFTHDFEELEYDGGWLQSAPHGIEQSPALRIGPRRAERAIELRDRRSLTIHGVEFSFAERIDKAAVRFRKSECGGCLHPGQQLRVARRIRYSGRGPSGDFGVHSHDARNHGFGNAARAIHGHHGGESSSLQAAHRILAKRGVFPHSGTHGGLRQFKNDGGYPADEERDGVLEDMPRQRIRWVQRGFSRRASEIDCPAVPRIQESARGGVEPWSRRPSSHCQDIRAGRPHSTSRIRLAMETASANSLLMPRACPNRTRPASCTPIPAGTTNAKCRTAWVMLSSTTAVPQPTGCSKRRKANQISKAPKTSAANCKMLATSNLPPRRRQARSS